MDIISGLIIEIKFSNSNDLAWVNLKQFQCINNNKDNNVILYLSDRISIIVIV